MSWELASFLILGAVLLGGFAWYERSRPPSQVVALVAALAALAIAGRIAFAAFPNVKPTTDIVIFAGYALGAAPGFAVGALAALVSNFWFGQGPWTPWQMAGWGLCGVLGAGAGRSAARNAGRLTLGRGLRACWHRLRRSAELLPDGDLRRRPLAASASWRLEARASRSTPPTRSATSSSPWSPARRWSGCWPASASASSGGASARTAPAPPRRGLARRCAAAASLLAPRPAVGAPAGAARRGLRSAAPPPGWSRPRTPTAASAPRPRTSSGAEMTAWAMLGLEAAGRNPLDVSSGGKTPVDFLRANVDELQQRRRLRPHDPRPRGRRRRPAHLRRRATWSPRCSTSGATTAPTRAGRELDRLRGHRPARRRSARRRRAVARLAAQGPERRRRLGRRARVARAPPTAPAR